MRIGFASDIHKLVIGRPLILGGVHIPSEKGESANSDGDVVYHALAESLLGSLALGDLGTHFPDNDPQYKNIDSSILVKKVMELIDLKGYRVNNIDISITLEQPKLRNYIESMRKNIAKLTNVTIDQVSVKAGTNEQLDQIGQGNAVKAEAIVLIIEK